MNLYFSERNLKSSDYVSIYKYALLQKINYVKQNYLAFYESVEPVKVSCIYQCINLIKKSKQNLFLTNIIQNVLNTRRIIILFLARSKIEINILLENTKLILNNHENKSWFFQTQSRCRCIRLFFIFQRSLNNMYLAPITYVENLICFVPISYRISFDRNE